MPRSLQTDRWLFLSTLALCLIGAVMVFSASAVIAREQHGNAYFFLLRQLLWLALGLVGMFWIMNLDYRKLRQPAVIFSGLFAALVLLVAVFLLDKSHATHRWIRLGPASLQPSEFAKLAVILYLAWFLEMRRRLRGVRAAAGINDLRHTLGPALGPVLLLVGLVVLQPDLGTAIEIFLIALAMMFVAGLDGRYILGAGVAALPLVYLLIVRVSYRYERVIAFLNPEADPQGHGFQLLQSLIAVGSGGLVGVGLMESRQKLFYLPEAHTDFIYAVLCEELGFIGGVLVLALFAIYGWRGLRAALAAPDDFGRLAALGITVMVVSQALINLGVVLGMMPTKGIPLPFISYGGSSLLVMLLATGVLLNISQQAD
ncbi:MAG: putative lipid II flippase FtsW [Acidobacteria bacterium]|nr:putative lipid II flippase FtsW [Acidobacteriota bacterium]